MTQSRMEEAAVDYVMRGWPVLVLHNPTDGGCSCGQPGCASVGKHPRIAGGLLAATTDAGQIGEWIDRWPEANLGIRTGALSGLVVLDIDPDHGGIDSLRELLARAGAELPEGLAVATGGGGAHLYFAHPGHRVANSAGRIGPGIDLRGDGGYVVAPPSRHASGMAYRVAGIADSIPELPSWLTVAREMPAPPVAPVRGGSAWAEGALRSETSAVRGAPEGMRNNTLNRAAFRLGQLVGAQLLRAEDVTLTLDAAALAAGLAERERAATIRSGLEAGIGRPRFGPEAERTIGPR